MTNKNYTEVTISGKTYTLGGYEDEVYLQRIATYINGKIGALRETQGFQRLTGEYQNVMLQMNMADDYFQQKQRAELLEERVDEMEKQIYELKHELVVQQIQREKEQNAE